MMNIEHIKSLSLKDYLANKGHYPVKEYTTYGIIEVLFEKRVAQVSRLITEQTSGMTLEEEKVAA